MDKIKCGHFVFWTFCPLFRLIFKWQIRFRPSFISWPLLTQNQIPSMLGIWIWAKVSWTKIKKKQEMVRKFVFICKPVEEPIKMEKSYTSTARHTTVGTPCSEKRKKMINSKHWNSQLTIVDSTVGAGTTVHVNSLILCYRCPFCYLSFYSQNLI